MFRREDVRFPAEMRYRVIGLAVRAGTPGSAAAGHHHFHGYAGTRYHSLEPWPKPSPQRRSWCRCTTIAVLAIVAANRGTTSIPGSRSPIGAVPSRASRTGRKWTRTASAFGGPASLAASPSSSARPTDVSATSRCRGRRRGQRDRSGPWRRPLGRHAGGGRRGASELVQATPFAACSITAATRSGRET